MEEQIKEHNINIIQEKNNYSDSERINLSKEQKAIEASTAEKNGKEESEKEDKFEKDDKEEKDEENEKSKENKEEEDEEENSEVSDNDDIIIEKKTMNIEKT